MIKSLRSSLRKNLMPLIYRISERFGFHIYPVHYYSPLPPYKELNAMKEVWTTRSKLVGLEMDIDSQIAFLRELKRFSNEYNNINYEELVKDARFGPGYGAIEALVLHAVIRYFQPSQIIEVGSGMSSYISLQALQMNDKQGNLTCIEPYPYKSLRDLIGSEQIIVQYVQTLDPVLFEKLNAGDILFIDSSHTVRLGGDIPYLYLEVLPRLKPGVIVHIHDISFPYTEMIPGRALESALFPTEVFMLQAFLAFNTSYKVLLCCSMMHFDHNELLKEVFPAYLQSIHRPSSIWLQRI